MARPKDTGVDMLRILPRQFKWDGPIDPPSQTNLMLPWDDTSTEGEADSPTENLDNRRKETVSESEAGSL
jgi:hypothetical protein